MQIPHAEKTAVFSHRSGQRAIAGLFERLARHRVLATILALAVFPLLMPFHALAINILLFGLFAAGYNLTFGYTGKLSFGHAAFYGTGAYACGILIANFGVPWPIAIAAGIAMGGLAALLIGVLAIRTRGIYFAMVTLALSQCVFFAAFQATTLTGGDNGLRGVNVPVVDIGGLHIDLLQPLVRYYFMLSFVAAAIWLLSRVLESPFGAALEAIRENDQRARASGFDVDKMKLLSFVVSGLFCGLAGALTAINQSTVGIDMLSYHTSGQVMMVTLLGGMGTFFGPFMGAATFLGMEHLVTAFTERWQIIVGLVFMGLVLFLPKGIWGTLLDRVKP